VIRVGWVVDGPLEQLSGGYLYDRLVVEYLRRHDFDVTVVSLSSGSYGGRLTRGIRLDLEARLAACAADIVVQDELSHPALVRANRRLKASRPGLRRVGLVHHLRSSEPRAALANLFYRWVERLYLATLGAFIFNSRATRAAVQRLGLPPSPSIIAVPGADRLAASCEPEGIRARAARPGPLRVLFLGNLIPRKGLLTLIEAVALVPGDAVELSVVGSPEVDAAYARRVRRRVEVLRLAQVTRFLGVLDGAALTQVMAEAHVLAVPSAYEGYGMAHLEGMGFGLPAIAGVNGGAAEFVRSAENGFLVDPADAAALAVHLASLHTDRARLARMGLAARETFLAAQTWEQTGAAIGNFLSGLTHRPDAEIKAVLSSADR
jgi:glycosyltransferase involved in cell wall biosynthesis